MCRGMIAAALFALPAGALAQNADCIENAVGETVCGADAAAVRARMEAEAKIFGGNPRPASPAPVLKETAAQPDAHAPARAAGPQPAAYAASGQTASRQGFSRGSAYNNYGQSVFLRGGYAFAANNYDDGEISFGGPILSGGYRRALRRRDFNQLSIEGEIVFARDSEEFDLLGVPVEDTLSVYTGLVGLRYDASPAAQLNPFASLAIGPSYLRARSESGGVSVSDGSWAFGYSARAGLEANLSEQVSIEGAYRYLGATEDGTIAIHAAEIGLNYDF